LSPPITGALLLLYVATLHLAISAALLQEKIKNRQKDKGMFTSSMKL
jgi:hypothetical protein